MGRIVYSGFNKPPALHAWAIVSNGTLYSVHVPIRPDGSIEDGDATRQAEAVLSDLQVTLDAAGTNFEAVNLVQIFLTSLEHKPAIDEVYMRYFKEAHPVRACVGVLELPTPGTIIEMVVTTTISN